MNKKTLAIALIMTLTGAGSFGLGRLSVLEKNIENKNAEIIVPKLQNLKDVDESTFGFVASKNGTKYYPVNCSSASRINDENKVYFETEQEALDAGLEKSSTCD